MKGQFVDHHDINAPDPRSFDVLISDIDEYVYRSEIAENCGN